jgi:hypothetical protein
MESNIKYQEGVMVKDPRDMTDSELAAWVKKCAASAREYLFSINQPLVYVRADGHTIAEYKNGSVMVVR